MKHYMEMMFVLDEVSDERHRQDKKWGEQNLPDGTAHDAWALQRDIAQSECEAAKKAGTVTFRHVLMEEVLEALAETDPTRLRAELVQVAAVAVQWVEAIDRRVEQGRAA